MTDPPTDPQDRATVTERALELAQKFVALSILSPNQAPQIIALALAAERADACAEAVRERDTSMHLLIDGLGGAPGDEAALLSPEIRMRNLVMELDHDNRQSLAEERELRERAEKELAEERACLDCTEYRRLIRERAEQRIKDLEEQLQKCVVKEALAPSPYDPEAVSQYLRKKATRG